MNAKSQAHARLRREPGIGFAKDHAFRIDMNSSPVMVSLS